MIPPKRCGWCRRSLRLLSSAPALPLLLPQPPQAVSPRWAWLSEGKECLRGPGGAFQCSFAGRGFGLRAVVARRVRALQSVVAERPLGHPCLSLWTARLGACEAIRGCPQMQARPLASCPGSLPARHQEPNAPAIRLPQRWDCQSLAEVSQEAGWPAPWETQTGKAFTEIYCLDPPLVIFVWGAQMESYLMRG